MLLYVGGWFDVDCTDTNRRRRNGKTHDDTTPPTMRHDERSFGTERALPSVRSLLFPLSLSLQKQDPDILLSLDIAPEISHITKPRYREISHITKSRYRQFPLRLRPSPPPRRSLGPEMTRARMRVMILLVKRERVPFIRSKSWSKKVCVLLQYL